MHLIDWIFVVVPLVLVIGIVIYTRSYMRSVADFLSGGRLAGRYLLTMAKGEMGAGAVVFVASFEMISQAGFTMGFWAVLQAPLLLMIALTGFVVYRYRETRAMTLAQFFEIRYSKAFRVFTGFLGFGAGILNFGIIPVIGARFLTYILDLPPTVNIFGMEIQTAILLMGVLLSITLFMTLSGGLISLMMADCLEGIISQILYLVIIFGLIYLFDWNDIVEVLGNRPEGRSLLNPFDSLDNQDFNIWFVLMAMFISVYGTMAWQNQSAFNSAAISAHESQMAGILSKWRELGKAAVVPLLAVCAMTYLNHPHYADRAAVVHQEIEHIADSKLQRQMTIPITVEHMLPIGVRGALCVILLMGVFGGDGTHLHSWGSLLIQDIVVPLRKKPLTPQEHILWLRLSITGVAFFAFIFGCFFQQMEYINMWWAVTMGIYVGGAGACIIGGLYWRKGTTAGAWSALLTGSILAGGGIIIRQIMKDAFPLNGQQISFIASLIAVILYIVVSLLTCKEDFNMERMLHRGKYAKEKVDAEDGATKKISWGAIIGINSNFSCGDKWIASGLFCYSLGMFGLFTVVSIWNLIWPWPLSWWSIYWYFNGIALPIFFAVVTAVWFTWGGMRDMRLLFARLKTEKVNVLDNGMVIENQNIDSVTRTHNLTAETKK